MQAHPEGGDRAAAVRHAPEARHGDRDAQELCKPGDEPAYRVQLPAQHIPARLRVCHFSGDEQRRFIEAYARAHPGQAGAMKEFARVEADVLQIPLPRFDNPAVRDEVEALVRDFAERVIALAERQNQGGRP